MQTSAEPPPGVAWCAKRGTAYGAAAGLLIGLIYLAVVSEAEVTEVVIWRNFILAGAAVGLTAGLVVGFVIRARVAAAENKSGDGDDSIPSIRGESNRPD